MANNVSTLGLNLGIISRTKSLQGQMADLQAQVATGVKYQTFGEYGSNAQRIQEYRTSLTTIDIYRQNIDISLSNIEQMDSAIEETIEQAKGALSSITIQLERGSEFDLVAVKTAAQAALKVIEANMNVRIGDRYLFAGTDVSNEPYTGSSTVTANMQTQIADWLDGTNTTTQLLSNIDNLTDSQLGYSVSVQTAKNIFVRADDSLEVDYTVKANDDGFSKIVAGLNALANLEEPGTGDIPTRDEFYDVVDSLYRTVKAGIDGLRDSSSDIALASETINTIKNNLTEDKQAYQKVMEQTEATDVTDAIVRFQSMQTQLDASFRISAILGQLSLTRIL
ncbi:MAG: hypothetical protein KGQ41_04675 [Alphaproteobacteria bacterium]|nr:hypothetical protein [Alphaproteobacteria bacterium]